MQFVNIFSIETDDDIISNYHHFCAAIRVLNQMLQLGYICILIFSSVPVSDVFKKKKSFLHTQSIFQTNKYPKILPKNSFWQYLLLHWGPGKISLNFFRVAAKAKFCYYNCILSSQVQIDKNLGGFYRKKGLTATARDFRWWGH